MPYRTNGQAELFGRWMKGTMRDKRIKQRTIAVRLNEDEAKISRWATGKQVPDPVTCITLGRILEVDNPSRVLIMAGHMPVEAARTMGLEPLPIPEADEVKEEFIKSLERIPHTTKAMRQEMLKVWERSRK